MPLPRWNWWIRGHGKITVCMDIFAPILLVTVMEGDRTGGQLHALAVKFGLIQTENGLSTLLEIKNTLSSVCWVGLLTWEKTSISRTESNWSRCLINFLKSSSSESVWVLWLPWWQSWSSANTMLAMDVIVTFAGAKRGIHSESLLMWQKLLPVTTFPTHSSFADKKTLDTFLSWLIPFITLWQNFLASSGLAADFAVNANHYPTPKMIIRAGVYDAQGKHKSHKYGHKAHLWWPKLPSYDLYSHLMFPLHLWPLNGWVWKNWSGRIWKNSMLPF